jgi:hypothetical protein
MTIFIITTLKDNHDGTSVGFDAKSDFGSPSKIELQLLSDYLTPKALTILQDILAKQLESFGKEPTIKQSNEKKA